MVGLPYFYRVTSRPRNVVPVAHWVRTPPYKGRTWADVRSLFEGLSRVRGFEERLRLKAVKTIGR